MPAMIVTERTLAAMEEWSRWRCAGAYGAVWMGGSGGGLLGRLQSGKRVRTCPRCEGTRRIAVPGYKNTRRCPRCRGAGELLEDLATISRTSNRTCRACEVVIEGVRRSTGEINGKTCIFCGGSGRRIVTERTVHPASIAGTVIYGTVGQSNPVCSLISAEVLRWAQQDATLWWHYIVLEEYQPADNRTREQRAVQMGLSPSFYSRELKKALLAIQTRLETLV